MEEFEVIFYETADGKCPVTDFINSLPQKMKEKVFKSIDILRAKGKIGKVAPRGLFKTRGGK